MNFKKILTYLSLPEMRLFTVFLPFAIAVAVVEFFYEPGFLFLMTASIATIFGVIFFLTSLHLARLNLDVKLERNELKSIIINLRDGVIAYDEDFKILVFNRAAESIFGVKAESVIGQKFSPERADSAPQAKLLVQVFFPSLAPMVIAKTEAGVFPSVVDITFTEPSRQFRVMTDKIIDPSGTLLGFVKIVTERTREVEFLRSKSEFVTVAAHQLRTPLTAVNWSLQTAVSDPALPAESKDALSMGLIAANKMSKIINDLLDVAKMEEGRFGYEFKNIDVVSFIGDLLSETMAIAKSYDVNIYYDRPDESIMLYIDPKKLTLAMSNLLDNALKYNVKNGSITVKLERLKNQPFIQISVADTGIGIPSDDVNKLFTKFFRADNAMKLETEGTGLGLYIVKNIILRHGGKVWLESSLNRGSTFYLTLPTDQSLVPPKEIAYEEEM